MDDRGGSREREREKVREREKLRERDGREKDRETGAGERER